MLAFEEARNIRSQSGSGSMGGMRAYYPGYSGYPDAQYIQVPPGCTAYMSRDGPVIVDQYGNQVVYINEYPYYRRRRHDGTDMALGVAAGAAMGSLLLWPWMLMPFWW